MAARCLFIWCDVNIIWINIFVHCAWSKASICSEDRNASLSAAKIPEILLCWFQLLFKCKNIVHPSLLCSTYKVSLSFMLENTTNFNFHDAIIIEKPRKNIPQFFVFTKPWKFDCAHFASSRWNNFCNNGSKCNYFSELQLRLDEIAQRIILKSFFRRFSLISIKLWHINNTTAKPHECFPIANPIYTPLPIIDLREGLLFRQLYPRRKCN